MRRTHSFPSALLIPIAFGLACDGADTSSDAPDDDELTARARAIHERVITIDTHDDIPPDFATPAVDPGVRGDRQVDLPKMTEGGLDVAFFIVYVGQTPRTEANYEKAKADAMVKFDAIHRMTKEMYPDGIELAHSAADVERIHNAGKLVAAIGIENGYVIGKDLELLEKYHRLGARYVTLAHNGHNDISDSAQPCADFGEPESEHGGISEFGERVIAEMNRLGIMVDVSHISKQAMLDAVRLSRAPVIASHSSARALADVARNMDDEQLRALKENGGVIQITAVSSFLVEDSPEKQAEIQSLFRGLGVSGFCGISSLPESGREEFRRKYSEIQARYPRATVEDFVDHIDHVVQVIGIDHVGISSDFDGGGGIVSWNDASESFNLTLELVRRGYSEEEIGKMWGANTLRVWRAVERVAADMRRE